MRPSSMRWTWPSQRSLRGLSKVYKVGRPAPDRTSALVTLSCQDMPRIWRRLLIWKVLNLLSCFTYVVHVSLTYNNVPMTQYIVLCHLRSSCQLRVCPNSSCEASECRSCLADPLVYLSGAEICKLLDGITFVFIGGNEWGCPVPKHSSS